MDWAIVTKNYWASHNNAIRPADPVSVQFISMKFVHDPQTDMVGPNLHVFIGTRASRPQRDLNRPANKEHVFPLLKGYDQRAPTASPP
jgi:hypothetical protein